MRPRPSTPERAARTMDVSDDPSPTQRESLEHYAASSRWNERSISADTVWRTPLNARRVLLTCQSRSPIVVHQAWVSALEPTETSALHGLGRFTALRSEHQFELPMPRAVSGPAWAALGCALGTVPIVVEAELSREVLFELAQISDYLGIPDLLLATSRRLRERKDWALLALLCEPIPVAPLAGADDLNMRAMFEAAFQAARQSASDAPDLKTLLKSYLGWLANGGEAIALSHVFAEDPVPLGPMGRRPTLPRRITAWLTRVDSDIRVAAACAMLPQLLDVRKEPRSLLARLALDTMASLDESHVDPELSQAGPPTERWNVVRNAVAADARDFCLVIGISGAAAPIPSVQVGAMVLELLDVAATLAPFWVSLEGADAETLGVFRALAVGDVARHPVRALGWLFHRFENTGFRQVICCALRESGADPQEPQGNERLRWVDLFERADLTETSDALAAQCFLDGFPSDATLRSCSAPCLAAIVRQLRSRGVSEDFLMVGIASRWVNRDPAYLRYLSRTLLPTTQVEDLRLIDWGDMPKANAFPLVLACLLRTRHTPVHQQPRVLPREVEVTPRVVGEGLSIRCRDEYLSAGPFRTQRVVMPHGTVRLTALPWGVQLMCVPAPTAPEDLVLGVLIEGRDRFQWYPRARLGEGGLSQVEMCWHDGWGLASAPSDGFDDAIIIDLGPKDAVTERLNALVETAGGEDSVATSDG